MIGSALPLVFLGGLAVLMLGTIVLAVILLRGQQRQAKRAGYPSLAAYLRAAPRTDEEKRAAADLALKGMAICLLGLVFAPLLLVGLLPCFYGVRKVVYASMGLGLVDDVRQPQPPLRNA